MWKIQKTKIKEGIYCSLICHALFHEEQKGYHNRTRETGDLLYIDLLTLKESKVTLKNVTISWIDYKKAYNMILQSWRVDALSPLLFLIAMIPLNYILRKFTGSYKFTKSQKIYHLIYMDGIKLFAKK